MLLFSNRLLVCNLFNNATIFQNAFDHFMITRSMCQCPPWWIQSKHIFIFTKNHDLTYRIHLDLHEIIHDPLLNLRKKEECRTSHTHPAHVYIYSTYSLLYMFFIYKHIKHVCSLLITSTSSLLTGFLACLPHDTSKVHIVMRRTYKVHAPISLKILNIIGGSSIKIIVFYGVLLPFASFFDLFSGFSPTAIIKIDAKGLQLCITPFCSTCRTIMPCFSCNMPC